MKLALRLEPVRDDFGPVMIRSGHRCERHNLDCGGKVNSMHLQGLAADIAVSCDSARFALVKALLEHGFIRLGIAKLYVHADLGTSTGPVLWTYYH